MVLKISYGKNYMLLVRNFDGDAKFIIRNVVQ